MQVCSIASGSNGNCIYIGEGEHHILIDAGISRKRIVEGLRQIAVDPGQLDAIFVTHEHIDHISGVPMMVKMFDVPVYATGGTLDSMRKKDTRGILQMDHLFQVHADRPVQMGNMVITPFRMSHDAVEPVCYTVEAGGHKASVATDLGMFDDYIISHLEGSELLLLEANHDISMLETGRYPYSLKRRILSETGHLSNEDSGRLLCRLIHRQLKHVFLAHLSEENNYPELAYETVKCKLWEELGMRELPFSMEVAGRSQPTEVAVA